MTTRLLNEKVFERFETELREELFRGNVMKSYNAGVSSNGGEKVRLTEGSRCLAWPVFAIVLENNLSNPKRTNVCCWFMNSHPISDIRKTCMQTQPLLCVLKTMIDIERGKYSTTVLQRWAVPTQALQLANYLGFYNPTP